MVINKVTSSAISYTGVWLFHGGEQEQEAFGVLDDLLIAQLRLSVDAIHERDWQLFDGVAMFACAIHHLHLNKSVENTTKVTNLEDVSLRDGLFDQLRQHVLLVQTKRTGQIGDVRLQHELGKEIGATRDHLSTHIPTAHATAFAIATSSHNVGLNQP